MRLQIKYDLDDSISAFNKAKEGKEFEVKAKAIVPSITKEDLEKNLFYDVFAYAGLLFAIISCG